ncbi:MAG TPA: glycosyltransferase, partial [Candidatus Acidoferrum sp.]|nr:glycosyltransferase [Candidatus Acidoferrum sp.]
MLLAYTLLALAVAGTLSSWAFLVLALGGAAKFHRDANAQRRQAESIPAANLPPVSLLKPVHGLESRLKENIESFFQLDYPQYEIIFAADLEDNAALAVVREICARYPQIPTQIVVTGAPPWPNPPAYAFFRMAEHAKNDILVTSDSDVLVDRNYLREVVPPLLDPKNGMLTCVYRGKNAGGFWSGVHAVGMSVEMTAGVVTANMLEGMKFGLGPTIVVRRDALDKIGGYSALHDYFANDFMLGNLIEKSGYHIVLSRHIIDHVVSPYPFVRVWRDEVRWARSTRGSRPWGHLFSGLIYAMPYGILGFAAAAALGRFWLGIALLAAALLNRIIESYVIGWGVVRDPAARSFWLYPLRDLLGFFVWAASYLGRYRAVWRNVQYDLTTDGRVVPRGGQPQSETP